MTILYDPHTRHDASTKHLFRTSDLKDVYFYIPIAMKHK